MAQSYVSKEEKKIPISDPSGKWSDMTLLPEWEEEVYNVYPARKHGKWVMLKARKERCSNAAKCRAITWLTPTSSWSTTWRRCRELAAP